MCIIFVGFCGGFLGCENAFICVWVVLVINGFDVDF